MRERPFELQSRDEKILASIIDGTSYTEEAQSRIEYLLLELKAVIAGGGDYEDLSNKPKINGETLEGNKTAAQLGLQSALTFDAVPTENSTNPVTSGGVYAVVGDINSVLEEVL